MALVKMMKNWLIGHASPNISFIVVLALMCAVVMELIVAISSAMIFYSIVAKRATQSPVVMASRFIVYICPIWLRGAPCHPQVHSLAPKGYMSTTTCSTVTCGMLIISKICVTMSFHVFLVLKAITCIICALIIGLSCC